MSDSSRSLVHQRRTTNALPILILVTLAAGFRYVGGGADDGTRYVTGLILSTMLWLPLVTGAALLLSRG